MNVYEMPVTAKQTSKYVFTTNLDGKNYNFEFCYNKRIDTYHFSVLDQNGQAIIANQACLSYVSGLTKKFAIDNLLPFGDLWVADPTGKYKDPGVIDFGLVVSAFYLSIRDEVV